MVSESDRAEDDRAERDGCGGKQVKPYIQALSEQAEDEVQ